MKLHKDMIQVYSIDKETAARKMLELVISEGDDVFYYSSDVIETEHNAYRAQKYSPCSRGNKYQHVYIDSRIDTEHIENIKMGIRPLLNLSEDELRIWSAENHVKYF